MTDVAKLTEQVEKLPPKPTEKRVLQKKVAGATPPSGKAAPEADSPDHAVKRALQPGGVGEKAELEAKVGRPAEASRGSRSTVVDRINGSEIEDYAPSAKDRRAILNRVEQDWGKRKLDNVAPDKLTNTEREGLGVESAVQKMKDSGEYTDLEQMGGRNKPDILALGKDGKLCVVECKGHTADVKDAGYINSDGAKAGNLASARNDGEYFENEPAWLESNRPYMKKHLQKNLDDPSVPPGEKAKSQRLLDALDKIEFRQQDSYHRITVTAGPQAEYGNVTDYVRAVKPEKMVQVRLPLKT